MDNFERLQKMSDEELLSVWNAIWECTPDERPDTEWQEDVYSEMSNRGLPAR